MDEKIYHLTKKKLQELKKEHAGLVLQENQKTVGQEAPHMLESDDLNPEFVSFQEGMDSLRGRIGELEGIFKNHKIIKNPPKDKAVFVDIGATVQLEDHGKKDEFMIVGTLEADPVAGKISNESPVGKALLGHVVGDEVVIPAPGKVAYKIKKIKYEVS